jgi:hypothetical protein
VIERQLGLVRSVLKECVSRDIQLGADFRYRLHGCLSGNLDIAFDHLLLQ